MMGQTVGGGRSQGYQGLRDMLDGGGAGATGSEFQGGLLSQIANSLGIKPLGSRDRMGMGQIRPQMGPQVSAQGPMPSPSPQPGPQPSAGPAVYEQQRAPQLGAGPAIYEQMRGREPMGPPMAPIGQPGPPTRARVSPQPKATDLLDQFEAQIAASPIGARLRDQMNANPDAVEALMLQWVRNGYKLPGM